jgi:phosphate transport system substrate-binding protein
MSIWLICVVLRNRSTGPNWERKCVRSDAEGVRKRPANRSHPFLVPILFLRLLANPNTAPGRFPGVRLKPLGHPSQALKVNATAARLAPMRHALMLAALIAACTPALPELRIDGSPGVAPLVAALAEEYRGHHPRVTVTIGPGLGSSARVLALAEGRIHIAMASHGIDTSDLRRRGIAAVEIARTPVVFAVNAANATAAITSRQACDILQGRLTAWSDRTEIVPLMRPANEVDAEVAMAALPCLANSAPADSVRIIERPDSMAAALARDTAAFGLTSMPYVRRSDGRIRALDLDGVAPSAENVLSGRYPMARRAFLLVPQPAPPHVSRFLEFIRGATGQRVLRDAGAIPIPF